VLPLELKAGEAVGDPKLHPGRGLPDYVKNYARHP